MNEHVYEYVYVSGWVNDTDCRNQMGSHRMLHLFRGPGSGQMYDVALPPGNSSRAGETIHRAPGPPGHQRLCCVLVFFAWPLSCEYNVSFWFITVDSHLPPVESDFCL